MLGSAGCHFSRVNPGTVRGTRAAEVPVPLRFGPTPDYSVSKERPTANTYFVKMNGMRWPRCIASEEGPLPVYR